MPAGSAAGECFKLATLEPLTAPRWPPWAPGKTPSRGLSWRVSCVFYSHSCCKGLFLWRVFHVQSRTTSHLTEIAATDSFLASVPPAAPTPIHNSPLGQIQIQSVTPWPETAQWPPSVCNIKYKLVNIQIHPLCDISYLPSSNSHPLIV